MNQDGISIGPGNEGSGWLLDPTDQSSSLLAGSAATTQQSANSASGSLFNKSAIIGGDVALLSAASNIQHTAGKILNSFHSANSTNALSFDEWFFNGSSSAEVYILGIFLLFLFICLILSPIVIFLICFRSRSSSNSVLFHYYLANFVFLIGQLIRFVRAQDLISGECARLGQVGPWFFMDILATPVSYIALALLSVERFVFYTGHSFPPLRWLRSPIVLWLSLLACWLLLGGLNVGLFLLLRMLSLSDIFRPVASKLTDVISGSKPIHHSLPSRCPDPLSGRLLTPVRDIITALFICTIIIPSIGSFAMQTILHCLALKATRRKTAGMQRTTLLTFSIIVSHLVLTLPHTTIGIFVPSNYRALAWLLTLRTIQHLIALILFLVIDQAAYTIILTYLLRRKPPLMSSTLNRTGGDIDNLIASVDVTPNTFQQSIDMGDHISMFNNGANIVNGSHHRIGPSQSHQYIPQQIHQESSNLTAQHPYLAIRPAQLYFERPDSTTILNGRGIVENTFPIGLDGSRSDYYPGQPNWHNHLSNSGPPPLPPRRWHGGRTMRHHSGTSGQPIAQVPSVSGGGTNRSLPNSRRRVVSRRHDSHHDLRRGEEPTGFNSSPTNPPNSTMQTYNQQQFLESTRTTFGSRNRHKPPQQQRSHHHRRPSHHRNSQQRSTPRSQGGHHTDYRRSLLQEENKFPIDYSRMSPGGTWFDFVITNEDEV